MHHTLKTRQERPHKNNDAQDNGDGKKQYKRRGPGRRMGGNQQRKKPITATSSAPQNVAPVTPNEGGEERLHKVLANVGIGSRREMETLIAEGKVEVNGAKAKVGQKVKASDRVHVKRRPVNLRFGDNKPQVLLYHKPAGEIVTRDDPEERDTVFQGLPRPSHGKWVAVGRLDYNSEGLLIFTTSGELANRLMHPRYEIKREYSVRVLGELSPEQEDQLVDGVMLDDGLARAMSLERIDVDSDAANHWYRIIMQEGRNREVRRMFEAIGLMVSRLIRVRYGEIEMPSWLKRGQHKLLDEGEVNALLTSVGMRTPEEKAAKLARYSTNPIHLQKQMDAMPGVLAGIEQDDKVKPLSKKDKADLKALDKKIAREMAADDREEPKKASITAAATVADEAAPRIIVPKRTLTGRKVATYTVVNGRAAAAGSALAEVGELMEDRQDVPRGKPNGKPFAKEGYGGKYGKGFSKASGGKKPAYVGVYDPFSASPANPASPKTKHPAMHPQADDDNFGNFFLPEKQAKPKREFKPAQGNRGPDKNKIKVKVDRTAAGGQAARFNHKLFSAPHMSPVQAPLDENGMPVFEVPRLYGHHGTNGNYGYHNGLSTVAPDLTPAAPAASANDKPKRPIRRGMRKIVPREQKLQQKLAKQAQYEEQN